MGVETRGFDEAERELLSAPAQLARVLYETTREGTALVADAIRADTPVHTGRLLAGWKTKVEETVDGGKGTISNKVRYGPFVERGAHPYKPMRAQPMVAEGTAATMGTVRRLYEVRVEQVVNTL
jgi:Bacteriophage HK97-gp10, putative tail-component